MAPKESEETKRDVTEDPETTEEEPEAKRQATEEKKAELEDPHASSKGGILSEGAVEEGKIFFLYRPKVNQDDPKSLDDIARFYMILSPTAGPGKKHRLLVVGKKRLPKAESHERYFGFVEAVADSADELLQGMGPEKYETKTRGTREKPGARIAAEGVYSITGKGQKDTTLAYKLELPESPGEVQQELEIQPAAAHQISLRNPDKPNTANAGLDQPADFVKDDKKMEETFGSYAWAAVKDPMLLDHERCEFLLIGRAANLEGGGVTAEAKKELEEAAKEEKKEAVAKAEGDFSEEEALLAQLRQELHPNKAGVEDAPVKDGDWK